MADYNSMAQQQYDPEYNAKVQALKNTLATNLQSLDASKAGVNTNYDTQVTNQNLQNTKNRNSINNSALSRGLNRSSIVTSGLNEANQINTRQVGQINTARTGALNNIEQEKNLANTNTNNSLLTMQGDRASAIANLARQLQQQDWDNNYKQQQLDLQKQSAAASAAQAAATAKSQAQAADPWATMQNILKTGGYGSMINWLQDNKSSLVSSVGAGEYQRMRAAATQTQQSIRNNTNYDRMTKSW